MRRLIDGFAHKAYIDNLRRLIEDFELIADVDPDTAICAKYCTFEELVKYIQAEI